MGCTRPRLLPHVHALSLHVDDNMCDVNTPYPDLYILKMNNDFRSPKNLNRKQDKQSDLGETVEKLYEKSCQFSDQMNFIIFSGVCGRRRSTLGSMHSRIPSYIIFTFLPSCATVAGGWRSFEQSTNGRANFRIIHGQTVCKYNEFLWKYLRWGLVGEN